MTKLFSLSLLLFAALSISAQKNNDAITSQLKSLKADKQITLSYDSAANATKIMVIADNFADAESKKAGIQAMNFGMAFFYPGKALAAPPETINFTFWVLSQKPQFAGSHAWKATVGTETLDLGDSRYAPKPSDNMEYLNFKITRADLAKIAAGTNVQFKLGAADFTFTAAHIAIFKSLIAVTDIK